MMKQGLFTIESNECVADRTYRMVLSGDTSAFTAPGQFLDIAIEGKFLRRPFAPATWNANDLTIYFKVVGEGTHVLSHCPEGSTLDVLSGLGNGFSIDCCPGRILIVSGGLGAVPVYSLAEALSRKGAAMGNVTAVMGFNTASEMVLVEEMKALGAQVHIVTMDGSVGQKGLVTDAMATLDLPSFERFYTCGPLVMMRAVCGTMPERVPGQVSLEERMGCGCGICYGCTCHTSNGPKRVCADGPVFNREEVIWEK